MNERNYFFTPYRYADIKLRSGKLSNLALRQEMTIAPLASGILVGGAGRIYSKGLYCTLNSALLMNVGCAK